MRILLISHNIYRGDGQGRVNFELARACLGEGHQLTLIADRIDPALVEQGAKWVPIHPLLDRPNLFKVEQFAMKADRLVRKMRNDFDLIIANGYVLTESHHVNISHFVHGGQKDREGGSFPILSARAWYQAIYTKLNANREKRAYGAATVVIAISHAIERELIPIGVPQHQIRVIYNGVDTEEFHPGAENPAELGLPQASSRGLFVGDIRSGRKNLDTVLRAMRSFQELRLIVVGKLPGSPYPEMARQLGVGDRVSFLGYRSDVASIMRACDFLVFPTRYEPFGLVVLEALSSGLPVIVTRAAGAAEVMTADCGVILEDPENNDALAAAMKQLADQQVRERMGKAARAVAREYEWRQMATRYLELFQSLGESSPQLRANGVR